MLCLRYTGKRILGLKRECNSVREIIRTFLLRLYGPDVFAGITLITKININGLNTQVSHHT